MPSVHPFLVPFRIPTEVGWEAQRQTRAIRTYSQRLLEEHRWPGLGTSSWLVSRNFLISPQAPTSNSYKGEERTNSNQIRTDRQ